ncbi:MAG: O-antigen ligase family protein [Candidatus Berkelbacteria bacterium]|nr:MAG: O-antigen ligase family protein [Candidatus Berkelbacteria bacterium]QQG51692.1 MAG: O-antigen ligase family protein [Candidatus Berkelbacteria bacterium]
MFDRALQLATLLIPFYFFRFTIGVPTNIFEVALALAIVVLLAERARSQRPLSGLPWAVWFFLAAATLSLLLNGLDTVALGIWKGWIVVPVLYFWLVRNLHSTSRLALLGKPFWLGLLAVLLWASLQKLGLVTTAFYQVGDPSFDQYLSSGRLFGPFESPNYLAMYLVPASFLGAYFVLRDRQNLKLWAAILVVAGVAVYWAGSRGGLLALGAAAALGLGVTYFPWRRLPSSAAILVGLGAISASIWQIIVGPDNLRREIYSYSLALIKSNWLTGIGLGKFQEKVAEVSGDNSHFTEFGLRYALHAHNVYLQFILTMGILGLFSWLVVIVQFFLALTRQRPLFLSLGAAMMAILIHGLFDTTYFKNDLAVLFWLTVALSPVWQNSNQPPQAIAAAPR